ncbi:CstA-like transporter-associated (seleno)protein [Allostreptomyces psammosilenae]|uniref:YbdD/YjiX family protein n=1 Tax=Allostreptomyces psammosilenae TaxID=1892865 RepID=A0A852ZX66_9ACTN|nr:CstA-like transporter-associated (seleno)protein [Allostreptomyces psammosilenae]NYI06307.1 hypothetical protein [Allostreptomyces psammosilenae]
MNAALTRIGAGARWLLWALREASGENRYARYAARARATGGEDARILTRAEFERHRIAEQEADPRGNFRCC